MVLMVAGGPGDVKTKFAIVVNWSGPFYDCREPGSKDVQRKREQGVKVL
jgi:hypothetical protein